MSPELISAIKERLAHGQAPEAIEAEVLAMGYAKPVFDAALATAQGNPAPIPAPAPLSVRTLFAAGIRFVWSRPDIFVLMLVPGLMQWLVPLVMPEGEAAPYFTTVTLIVALLALIIQLGIVLITTYIITRSSDTNVTIHDAAQWAKGQYLLFIATVLLSLLVVIGGFIFFIIPGFVLSITVVFSQYIFIKEGKWGMAAIVASRDIVRGQFWAVFSVLLRFGILLLALGFLFGIVAGIVGAAAAMGGNNIVSLVGGLIFEVFLAAISVASTYVIYQVYQSFSATKGQITTVKTPIHYWIAAGIGACFVLLVILAIVFSSAITDRLGEFFPETQVGVSEEVPFSFLLLSSLASAAAEENGGSYEGVCETLRSVAEDETGTEVTCNDTATAWALEKVTPEGVRLCADTATPGKEIFVPLGDKTECVALGQ